jgi:hypothetical protein
MCPLKRIDCCKVSQEERQLDLVNSMAELLCADLSNKPVRDHLQEWLDTSTALLAAGEYVRAKLLLNTILQAHPVCVQAHVQLVHTHLHLEQSLWPKAVQIAR